MMLKPVRTADNSLTLYVPELDEHYHSTHGAIQESMHVFIQEGLHYIARRNTPHISIFEVGFGTGLNAFLTCLEAEKLGISITYYSIEKWPISQKLALELNYAEQIANSDTSIFEQLHCSPWDESVEITNRFTLHKVKNSLQNYQPDTLFDLVYYDAFGPRAQGEMWEAEVLKKSADLLKPRGVWVSYCAKGQVKRDLRLAELIIEAIPGPPGKREMTRGIKK